MRIFVLYDRSDRAAADLLLRQLGSDPNLELTLVADHFPLDPSPDIRFARSLQQSSLVISLVGSELTRYRETEIEYAFHLGLAVIGVLTDRAGAGARAFHDRLAIPLVRWTLEDLLSVIRGQRPSFDYQLDSDSLIERPALIADLQTVARELAQRVIVEPRSLHSISPRQFEELIASLLDALGYDVTLTPQTRDRGIDIIAVKKEPLGTFLTIVDCKRYGPDRPVGVEIVRRLYGVLNIEKASHGMVATTSRFTADAKRLQVQHQYQLSLRDHTDILAWAQRAVEGTK